MLGLLFKKTIVLVDHMHRSYVKQSRSRSFVTKCKDLQNKIKNTPMSLSSLSLGPTNSKVSRHRSLTRDPEGAPFMNLPDIPGVCCAVAV